LFNGIPADQLACSARAILREPCHADWQGLTEDEATFGRDGQLARLPGYEQDIGGLGPQDLCRPAGLLAFEFLSRGANLVGDSDVRA
jgi:hypothetical protein